MQATPAEVATKLVPHGKGWAIILDPDLRRALGITQQTKLLLRVSGDHLIVTPFDSATRQEKFEAAKQDTFVKYEDALRRLAE